MNFYMEIAKLRAARILWHKSMAQFKPKNPKSSMLRTHCQTSGYSLTAQDPYNNVIRTTVEAMAAAFGGTQSLHTNALDEAIALPTDFSARIARNTQIILQEETDITRTVDPFGGSYFMESLTHDLVVRAGEIIEEVESHGGMTKAIMTGLPKLRIEESSARKQARIDKGEDVVVGVNKYQLPEGASGEEVEVRDIDNSAVRDSQIAKLEQLKSQRDNEQVQKSLKKLEQAAKSGNANLLQCSVEAMECRATVGEVSLVLEKVYGRFKATINSVHAVYGSTLGKHDAFDHAVEITKQFAQNHGRRPRILVAKLGQDGHDRGAKVVATGLADIGFDVDIGPLFQTPDEAAKQAIENDVHVVGVSSQAAGHKSLVPELIKCLKEQQAEDIKVIVGGVIPEQDYAFLEKVGVCAVFGPGTSIPECALKIIEQLGVK